MRIQIVFSCLYGEYIIRNFIMSGLVEKIRNAGIVGAGGAGFPAHVKADSRVDIVIANGAECEPVLYTDQALMFNHAGEILAALEELRRHTGAKKAVVALKKKYTDAIKAFGCLIDKFPDIELFLLDDFYPSGDEHVLVHEVSGRIVPEGGIPLEVKVLVQNVGTLLNIHEATLGKPVILKHLTVAGEVKRPGVYIAPVGTALAEVLYAAGGATVGDDFGVIEGGPMMGTVVESPDQPVTKTTSGFIVLPKDHPLLARKGVSISNEFRRAVSVCCQCRLCTDMCPRWLLGHSLQPHIAMRSVHYGSEENHSVLSMAYLCCLCGVCETYACPMGLSPKKVFMKFKEINQVKGLKNIYRSKIEKTRDSQRLTRVPKSRLSERCGISMYQFHENAVKGFVETEEVALPLKQHAGAPSIPAVKEGSRVNKGDIVAKIPEGSIGANIHASIDGVVTHVDNKKIIIRR